MLGAEMEPDSKQQLWLATAGSEYDTLPDRRLQRCRAEETRNGYYQTGNAFSKKTLRTRARRVAAIT